MKRRILIRFTYDGTGFSGSALQGDKRTVEYEINSAIYQLTKEVIEIISASRTDTGVHARDNIAVFDTCSSIPGERFAPALNTLLPEDVKITVSKEVSTSFHPRKMKTRKTYHYNIYLAAVSDPLRDRYFTRCSYELDVDAMSKAAGYIEGEHDFTSFCAAGSASVSKIRTVYSCRVYSERHSEITISVTGSGFLYNMVRIIAGTLMEVGRGRMDSEEIKVIIESKDRTLAGPTAPAKGLVLDSYEFI